MRCQRIIIKESRGVTLIELVTVMVILSIVLTFGSAFLVKSAESYERVQQRSKLINRGRQAVERMTRQLRVSSPYSLRLSGSGLCVEFMPVVAGGSYVGPDYDADGAADHENLPTASNGAVPAGAYAVETAPFDVNVGIARHFTAGVMSPAEIYTAAVPSSRASVGGVGATANVSVTLGSAHQFMRNSINNRFYLLDNPVRFCVVGGELYYYDNYPMLTPIADGQPAGSSASLLADNIGDLAGITVFALSGATQDRNVVMDILLPFKTRDGEETIRLKQTVMIRNVP